MDVQQPMLAALDLAVRETALFAGLGFLLLGLSDFAVDLIWIGRAAWRRIRRRAMPALAEISQPRAPGALAVFIPAWDEAEVIARMLRHALAAWAGRDFTLYVGCYPNDAATIAAVRSVADPKVRAVIGAVPGPTSKADCLNRLWEEMRADEQAQGWRFKAVLLHDAEDVVHSAELDLFDRMVERFDLVQIPVLPLIDEASRYVSGSYIDLFTEAHAKTLVVRQALGAAIPSAGVGCAVSREALERLAGNGAPFDHDSLVEDYELGLRLRSVGARSAFVRVAAGPEAKLVATRAFFPKTLRAAVVQQTRWVQGIALAGWDRLGWGGGIAECWMRMRDRQALLAALLLAVGYLAFLLWTVRLGMTAAGAPALRLDGPLQALLFVNGFFLLWRLGMRSAFVASAYGPAEGLRALPRFFVANLIAVLAAWCALKRHLTPAGGRGWTKTAHHFPIEVAAE